MTDDGTGVSVGRRVGVAQVEEERGNVLKAPTPDPFFPDRACFSMLTRGPQRARENETTRIGSKSAAEPHERVAKESQLERESI